MLNTTPHFIYLLPSLHLDNNSSNDEGTPPFSHIFHGSFQADQQGRGHAGSVARPQGQGIRQVPEVLLESAPVACRQINAQLLGPPRRPAHPRKKRSTPYPTQIETRIMRIVRDLEIINLRELRFDADLRSDLKIDSLNLVALLTSIEHEFTTVFEDNVFEGIANLNEVVTILMRDPKII